MLFSIVYIEYRIDSIKKNKTEKRENEIPKINPSEQQNTNRLYVNLTCLVILGVIVLGFVWYITHKYILTPLNSI
jgi:hypothetical protein